MVLVNLFVNCGKRLLTKHEHVTGEADLYDLRHGSEFARSQSDRLRELCGPFDIEIARCQLELSVCVPNHARRPEFV